MNELMLFMVGIVEMMVVTAWTETVTKARVIESGMVTIINIFIWYYVLDKIVNDIENFNLVLVYALGCSVGTMIGTYYISTREGRITLQETELKSS
ncbi:MAG: hypothetical protein UT05_C0001G0077 [Parcubacteria group bacterium GW2011_GWF2_38_76]|nr:MAG: hypothetical protein UT05_C0001G0077 [Parcubacteria group bacterium GW2011_GWF2_38_76]